MIISLKGKYALIGGASQGIGKSIAQQFAASGATCILLSRNAAVLQEVVNSLEKPFNQQHLFFAVDYADIAAVENIINDIVKEYPVHIVINNTGGPVPGLISEAGTTAFNKAFNQHIIVNQLIVQAVLPGMKQGGFGRIINITSTSVKIPLPNLGVSNTIRAAVAAWAKTLSNEVARYGITVNTVLPGFTDTPRLDSLINNTAISSGISIETVKENMERTIPVGRIGKPEETAAVVTFLASEQAAYINGVTLPVDGGRTGAI